MTFETPSYLGHIFYIGDTGLEGLFRDDEKNFDYDSEVSYEFYISRVDKSGEKIYLSNSTPPSIAFFKNRVVGDKIDVQLKLEIPVGYIFEIEPGLDCLLYDPKHQQTFEQYKSYSLFIEKLDELNGKIGVSSKQRRQIAKASVPKKTLVSKRNFIKSLRKGDTVKAKYKTSIEIGHFFEIERGIDGLVFDPGGKIRYLRKGAVYELIISKIDLKMERIGLTIKSK